MSKLPSTGPSLLRHLRQQQRQMVRVAQSSAFARSGTSVTAKDVTEVDGTMNVVGALVVDGTETVNGPLAVTGAADFSGNTHIGGALDVDATANFDGNTTIGGNLTVAGTLSLPNSIIPNDALTNPVDAGVGGATAVNFAVSATATDKVSASIPIPAGFTKVLVHVTAEVSAFNTLTSPDFLYVRGTVTTPVSGGVGTEMRSWVNSGEYTSVSTSYVDIFTGLTPGSITVACQARVVAVPWTIMAANTAHVAASIVFLR